MTIQYKTSEKYEETIIRGRRMFIADKQILNSIQIMSAFYKPQINDFKRLEK